MDRFYGPLVLLPIPSLELQELWKHSRLPRPQDGSLSHEWSWSNSAGRGQASQVLPTWVGGPAHDHHLLLCLSCCVLLCSRPHSPSGSLSHPLHCFVSRQGKDTHFHLSPRKTDPEGELPSLIRETQAAGWDGAMFQWANAPV